MKIIIAGGSGQDGTILARAFHTDGHEVIILSRKAEKSVWRTAKWDAETLGLWAKEFENADVVINLAGRSVNCRYTDKNRREKHQSPRRRFCRFRCIFAKRPDLSHHRDCS